MKYILVVRDHFTHFLVLRALPSKEPQVVAKELEYIFALIGQPMIFQTDNGKEFVAKLVVDLLKKANSSMTFVRGRPRNPADQGSVRREGQWVHPEYSSQSSTQSRWRA